MPKVTTHKANKDHPRWGIKKGDKYYAWKRKIGPAHGIEYKGLTYLRPSQLNSGFRGQLGDIEFDMAKAESPDDLRSFGEQRTLMESLPQGWLPTMGRMSIVRAQVRAAPVRNLPAVSHLNAVLDLPPEQRAAA